MYRVSHRDYWTQSDIYCVNSDGQILFFFFLKGLTVLKTIIVLFIFSKWKKVW